MANKPVELFDVVVITSVGKHEQPDYSFLDAGVEHMRDNYRHYIGALGMVSGCGGGTPYYWISTSDAHGMFLNLDRSEFEVIGTVK